MNFLFWVGIGIFGGILLCFFGIEIAKLLEELAKWTLTNKDKWRKVKKFCWIAVSITGIVFIIIGLTV